MKILTLIPVAVLTFGATLAYSDENADTSSAATNSNAAMTSDAVGGVFAGGSESGAHVGKTRSEVYQELWRAQKDGTLDRLNALYGGGN
ncbi:DUF4148 domain-containing protein [Paraburkholderia sp. RL17-383-BIF-A]|jgi:hypothetical protein|uniref:DUF4148 domain-containing protein n=1 Tax=Paraburkholderia TaxID=1822464 RepID=UPI0038BB8D24